MKKLLFGLLLISNLSTSAFAYANEFLTDEQKDTILTSIDNICGDTWCEGDFDYSFNSIYCDSQRGSCTVEMEVILREYDEVTWEMINETRTPSSCTVFNFYSYNDIIDQTRQWDQLTDDFYEKLSDCDYM
ncbi:MAG: hypothetical protein ISR65_18260 [Bacteriovoracaceae bacterium]|nr:hypothetical protein [Candidatus Brocadiales bacterium]MBL6991731.1 hypothetical protein [Bacteriovoracaceae bacterium]